ncbi:MAG: PilZ domain-containing protein [bacterium]
MSDERSIIDEVFFDYNKSYTEQRSERDVSLPCENKINMKLLLVVKDDEVKWHYQDEINKYDVEYDTVSSLADLYRALINTSYNGILLDVPTKVKASKDENILVHQVLEVFPVIRLRWDPHEKIIRTLFYGQPKQNNTIEHFINQTCRSFNARGARSSKRVNINANVLLSKTNIFASHNVIRTITIDVSKEGCFFYSVDMLDHFHKVHFIIKELEDDTPITAEVRWCVEWGKSMRAPGIGVKFIDIKMGQTEKISAWC